MTRINAGILPEELPTKALLAEHREIKRIPNTIKTGRAVIKNIPKEFKLGTGHCKFFYNKLGYLHKRYNKLYQEGLKRGYKLTNFNSAWDNIPDELMNDWDDKNAREILLNRLEERNHKLIKL